MNLLTAGLRRRLTALQDESGQVILMAAGGLAALLCIGALVIDIGVQAQARREAQNDADAMALAGAQELPDATDAEAQARAWGTKNDVDTSEVTYLEINSDSCDDDEPDEDYVTVRLRYERQTFLAPLLGITSTEVNVCATARATQGEGGYAIFANNHSCPGDKALDINGSLNIVEGRSHSNGWLYISGSTNEFDGQTTYKCGRTNSGSGNVFDPPSQQVPDFLPMPYDHVYADFVAQGCTRTMTASQESVSSWPNTWWMSNNPATKTLRPGIYCQPDAGKKIDLNIQGLSGNVTFATRGYITGGGSNFNLTAYWDDMLFFSSNSSDAAIDVSGSDGSWVGVIFAPNGRIKIAGSNNLSISGSLIADRVQTSGSDWSLTALNNNSGTPLVKLVE